MGRWDTMTPGYIVDDWECDEHRSGWYVMLGRISCAVARRPSNGYRCLHQYPLDEFYERARAATDSDESTFTIAQADVGVTSGIKQVVVRRRVTADPVVNRMERVPVGSRQYLIEVFENGLLLHVGDVAESVRMPADLGDKVGSTTVWDSHGSVGDSPRERLLSIASGFLTMVEMVEEE